MMLARAFQNAPIGRKIIAAFALLVVLFGVLGSLAIVQFSHFNAIVDDLTENYVTSLVELDDMRGNLAAFRVATLREQIAQEPSAAIRQQKDAELESMLAKIKAAEDRYAPTVTAGEERAIYEEFKKAWADYLVLSGKYRALLRDAKWDEAASFYNKDFAPIAGNPDRLLMEDAAFNTKQATTLTAAGNAAYAKGRMWIIGLLVVSLLVALVSGRAMIRSIAAPVRGMTAAMRRLATRTWRRRSPASGRGDEIGAMAGAVQVFKDNMIKADRLAAEQEARARAQGSSVRPRLETLVRDFEAKVGALVGPCSSAAATETGSDRAVDDGHRRRRPTSRPPPWPPPPRRPAPACRRSPPRPRSWPPRSREIGRQVAQSADDRRQGRRRGRAAPTRSSARWPRARRRSATSSA